MKIFNNFTLLTQYNNNIWRFFLQEIPSIFGEDQRAEKAIALMIIELDQKDKQSMQMKHINPLDPRKKIEWDLRDVEIDPYDPSRVKLHMIAKETSSLCTLCFDRDNLVDILGDRALQNKETLKAILPAINVFLNDPLRIDELVSPPILECYLIATNIKGKSLHSALSHLLEQQSHQGKSAIEILGELGWDEYLIFERKARVDEERG